MNLIKNISHTLWPLFLFACTESSMKMSTDMDTGLQMEFADEAASDYMGNEPSVDETDFYFIDVYPSDAVEGVLPQTLKVTQNELYNSKIIVDLQPTVTVSGYVYGYQILPTTEALPPGENIPLLGDISIEKKDYLNKSTTSTDASGYFELAIPKSSNYQFKIVPNNSAEIPFFVENIDIGQTQNSLDYELTPGIPVFGFIQFEDSNGLLYDDSQYLFDNIQVRVQDGTDGIVSDPLLVTEDGFFSIRAPEYVDEIELLLSSTDPSLSFPDYTFRYRLPDDGLYIEEVLPLPISNLVQGRLLTDNNQSLSERVTVRLTSIELTNLNGEIMDGSIMVETNNDINGYFSVNVPTGRYMIEVIPDYNPDASLAPTSVILDVDEDTNLGTLQMLTKKKFSGSIRNIQDSPLSNAQVSFRDLYFDHFIYSTTTDSQGKLDIFLPMSDYEVVILPSDMGTPISRRKLSLTSEIEETVWVISQGKEVVGEILYNDSSLSFALIEIRDLNGVLASGICGSDGEFSLNIEEILFQ